MLIPKRALATAELLLVFPAVLFMTSLVVRSLQPVEYEPAHTAQRIVDWFAGNTHLGLWVLLIALPLTVLLTGGAALHGLWNGNEEFRRAVLQALELIRTRFAELLLAGATAAAGVILAIVALHMAAN